MSGAMTQSSRTSEGRRRRIVIALTLAVAAAVAIPVMSRGLASAATATIKDDCTRGAPALRSCDFREVGFAQGVELDPVRVSPIVDNCGRTSEVRETFRYSVSVNRTITLEKGSSVSVTASPLAGTIDGSLGTIALAHTTGSYRLVGDGRTVGAAESLSGLVKAENRGFFMFAPLVGQSVGFLDAFYNEPNEEQFFPAKDSSDVTVNFPELLQDGRPDGYMFLRNVPCSQAIGPNDATADVSGLEQSARFNEIPQFSDELVAYE